MDRDEEVEELAAPLEDAPGEDSSHHPMETDAEGNIWWEITSSI